MAQTRSIFIDRFTADTREACLADLCAKIGASGAKVEKAETGKPFLRGGGGTTYGLAVTHLRLAHPPESFMAVAATGAIGIDAELWPQRVSDMAFLATVAAPEDYVLVQRLHRAGQDAGRFLWVAKEAALKASGAVMLDPHHVKIVSAGDGFRAVASKAATAPFADVRLRMFANEAVKGQELKLLAVALSGPELPQRTFDVDLGEGLKGLRTLSFNS